MTGDGVMTVLNSLTGLTGDHLAVAIGARRPVGCAHRTLCDLRPN